MQVTIYCMCPILLHPSKKHLAYFRYQGKPHLIFHKQGGIIPEVLTKSFELVDTMLSYYSKVTAVLIQLHQVQATADNKSLTLMIRRLKDVLKKHYQCEVGYLWVREQNKAESQHYHMIVMLNGHKCQQSKLIDIATQIAWQNLHPDNFSFRVRNRIYRIKRNKDDHESRALRMRLSYMAKKEGKNHFKSYTNVYRYSLLKEKGSRALCAKS